MRQIYSSPRTENIDRLVAMLDEAGIATSVTNRKGYGRSDYKRASYSTAVDRDTWPQVWIVNAEDQPRARAILREAGIEPATRYADDLQRARDPEPPARGHHALAWKIRIALIAIIVVLVALNASGLLRLF